MKRFDLVALGIAALAGASFPSAALPQAFPSKPVRVVMEYAPGAGGDLFFRVLAASISTVMGQPMIVENRAGGGGVLAMESFMQAAPDGYTLLGASQNVPITRKYLSKTGSIDVFRDLTPITAVWKTTMVITTTPSMPIKSLADMIRLAKAQPGKLSYGTSGIGTQGHFAGEMIKELAGIDMLHVPYKGNAIQDTVTGQIPLSISILNSAAPFIRDGRLRALAVASDKRLDALPDVPAVAEVLPKFEPPPSWTALFGPAGLPRPILDKLSGDIIKALSQPEVRAKAAAAGFMLIANTPEAFSAQIRRELDIVGRLVKSANIQPIQ